jgi:hypothetical protein
LKRLISELEGEIENRIQKKKSLSKNWKRRKRKTYSALQGLFEDFLDHFIKELDLTLKG